MAGEDASESPRRYRPNAAQWSLAGLIVAFVIGLVLFKFIKGVGLGQTAALYIGLLTVLALILTLSAPSGRVMGMTIKAITILLLLAMPVLGEGFICVLIAAPLFYAVGIIIAWLVQRFRGSRDPVARIVVIPVVALALSAEGVVPALTFPGDGTVTASRIVAARPTEVVAALAGPLRFSDTAPAGVLALGFPRPRSDHGGGLAVGDRHIVTFDSAHHRPPFVAAHHWGETASQLEFAVVEARGPLPDAIDSITSLLMMLCCQTCGPR